MKPEIIRNMYTNEDRKFMDAGNNKLGMELKPQ